MQQTEARHEGAGAGGAVRFLSEALGRLFARELLLPALLLATLLTFSNIYILMHMPKPGQGLPWQFLAGAAVRIGGLLLLEVGILRILTNSDRPRWRPDGALGLFALAAIAGMAISAAVGALVGDRTDPVAMLATNMLVTVALAPFAAWIVAIAVARPLAWRPSPYMRDFSRWLPYVILWSLLLVTPLAVLHGTLDAWLIRGAGDWFWPVALLDGPLSAFFGLIGFSLNAAAYRRVAEA